MTTSLPGSLVEGRLNCMEVWGGHGTTTNHFTRPGLDIWIWSRSQGHTDASGGDLHLLSSCASGRITRMLLADVCAQGPVFREIAGELRELMKRNINSIQQARMVNEMCRRLDDASHRGGFASALISTYFAPRRSLSLCNAGHPPPLLYCAKSGTWSIEKHAPKDTLSSDAPLGVVDPSEYQRFEMKLEVGDMVLSFSNALAECRGADGRILGLQGVLERVARLDAQQPAHLADDLVTQIQHEHLDNLAADDASILLCRSTDTPVAWRDNLLAPLRLMRAVTDKTTIRTRKRLN